MYFLLFYIFFVNIFLINGNIQKIDVKGRILCQGKPLQFLNVKLKEEDFFFDDILDENFTSEDGNFELSGEDDEIFNIQPYIQFTYTCCEYFENCQHDTKVLFPPKNLNLSSTLKVLHDFGNIDFHKPLQIIN
ncbi:Transthyretin-like family-containing protein [Strongyloides ratti]|uniref:Transthyretin-like family-containing protein n=1 Tax=Strongyloides ratti TaxID=34506 RepID=A0A090LHC6_STRRB|nr:Transthyretin-like family-containing protein [Strongyloides ratti]CEF66890.1 Transthyretin-like family-containing protein [Strongyloides ratti]